MVRNTSNDIVFFFNDTAATEIDTCGHTLSLPDALPIYGVTEVTEGAAGHDLLDAGLQGTPARLDQLPVGVAALPHRGRECSIAVPTLEDRKSTRLNSSH